MTSCPNCVVLQARIVSLLSLIKQTPSLTAMFERDQARDECAMLRSEEERLKEEVRRLTMAVKDLQQMGLNQLDAMTDDQVVQVVRLGGENPEVVALQTRLVMTEAIVGALQAENTELKRERLALVATLANHHFEAMTRS